VLSVEEPVLEYFLLVNLAELPVLGYYVLVERIVEQVQE
jgi:hypothetical protein